MSFGISTGGFFGGIGGGSKPAALRTEYASDGNYSGSYHGDIVFYLQRAGSEEEEEDELNEGQSQGDFNFGEYPEGIVPDSGLDPFPPDQSMWNQVGAGESAGNIDFNTGGTAGGGAGFDTEVIPGSFSTNASRRDDLKASLQNAFQNVPTFDDAYERISEASSEHLFNNLLDESFNPTLERDILGSLERGCRADLAVKLARATGGVTSTRDLIAGVNRGSIGLVTPGFEATSKLLGGNSAKTRRGMR